MVLLRYRGGSNSRLISGLGSLDYSFEQRLQPDAVELFSKQSGLAVEVRSAKDFHDRFLIVDSASCFQSGASFKDGGAKTPTTLTQITDAFGEVLKTYDGIWATGTEEFVS